MRIALALVTFASLILSACATVPSAPAGPVRLAPEGPQGSAFEVLDGRDGAAIAGAAFDVGGEASLYLGDDRFSPSRISVLSSALHA
jgi:hypothetical protein